jgi:hypothetical protein
MIRRSNIAKRNLRRLRTRSDEYCGMGFICLYPCDETKSGPRRCDGPFRSAYLGDTFKADLKSACRRWCCGLNLRVDAYNPSLSCCRRESLASVALEN